MPYIRTFIFYVLVVYLPLMLIAAQMRLQTFCFYLHSYLFCVASHVDHGIPPIRGPHNNRQDSLSRWGFSVWDVICISNIMQLALHQLLEPTAFNVTLRNIDVPRISIIFAYFGPWWSSHIRNIDRKNLYFPCRDSNMVHKLQEGSNAIVRFFLIHNMKLRPRFLGHTDIGYVCRYKKLNTASEHSWGFRMNTHVLKTPRLRECICVIRVLQMASHLRMHDSCQWFLSYIHIPESVMKP